MTDTPELAYLDNSATSHPKPPQVIQAVRDALDHSLTVARSTHNAEFRADRVLARCRTKLAKFFGAEQPEEIIYTYSATDGLNIALNGLVRPGGHVIVSPLEHHSVMRPLYHMHDATGVEWSEIPAGADGVVDPEAIRSLVRPATCLIALNWISNVSGTMQPAAEIGRIAAELGLPYLIDAAQVTGTHRVDVAELGCDAMAQPGHKALMTLPGMGVLYVRRGAPLSPWRIGGTGYRSDLVRQPEDLPMRYESGTPNVPAIVGLDAAMDWFDEVGIDSIQQKCFELTDLLHAGLMAIPGVTPIGPPPSLDHGHLVSFTVDDSAGSPIDPLVFSEALAERHRITSRAGLHCAPTAHRHFNTFDRGGTVRFSVSYFTTPEEIDYALACVREVAAGLGAQPC
jgi:cysteine desulfurase family protein